MKGAADLLGAALGGSRSASKGWGRGRSRAPGEKDQEEGQQGGELRGRGWAPPGRARGETKSVRADPHRPVGDCPP